MIIFFFCSRDLTIKVSVYDRDVCSVFDDLIGTTTIDIENRLRSKHRAFGGIPQEYNRYKILFLYIENTLTMIQI